MQTELTLSSTRRKHAGHVSRDAVKTRLGWSDILRVIQGDWARSYVLSRFREAGYTGDSWSDRKAREKMSGLLTAAEDALELRSQGSLIAVERAAIGALRRRLESELWA